MLRCIITRKGKRKECIIDFLEQLEQQEKKSFELKKVDLTNREKTSKGQKKKYLSISNKIFSPSVHSVNSWN